MCYYSKQDKDAKTLEKRFKAKFKEPDLFKTGNYNGFDHPKTPIITNQESDKIVLGRWGLIPDSANPETFQANTLNARVEEIHEKKSYKDYTNNRCLILIDGFYEWQWLTPSGSRKQKYIIGIPDEKPFVFAGLWNNWKNPRTGETLMTYTVLMMEAFGLMAEIHNSALRMPIMLKQDNETAWLEGGEPELINDSLIAEKILNKSAQQSLF